MPVANEFWLSAYYVSKAGEYWDAGLMTRFYARKYTVFIPSIRFFRTTRYNYDGFVTCPLECEEWRRYSACEIARRKDD
jgi:hypothetical protein